MILAALGWLGRKGARAIALSLFAGLALPPLSALFAPLLSASVFAMLVLAFVRVDAGAALARLRRPFLPLACIIWMMLITPVLMGLIVRYTGLEATMPGLAVALLLVAAGAPIMSTPAFSYMLGLDGVLSLAVLLFGQSLLPFAAPAMADFFLDEALPLSPVSLGLRLGLLIAGALLVALPLRRLVGMERIRKHSDAIDGCNIILLFIFAVAIMDGVVARFLTDPWLVLGVMALSFAILTGFFILTTAFFIKAGLIPALTLGISASNRNLGLFAAALAGHAPELAMIYFAVGQFPVYLFPWLIEIGLKRHNRRRIAAAGGS